MSGEFKTIRDEMSSELKAVRGEMNRESRAVRGDLADIRERLARVETLLERNADQPGDADTPRQEPARGASESD
jgi:hypothetical protein